MKCLLYRKMAYPAWYLRTILGVIGLGLLHEYQERKKKRYHVTEDPDELGYWIEEVKDD